MKRLAIAKGLSTLVDDEDYDRLAVYKWRFHGDYVIRDGKRFGEKSHVFIHREIMRTPKGLFTDHINHDVFDNRKSNLRIVTNTQNQMNKKQQKSAIYSKYKGVGLSKRKHGYRARIVVEGKEKHLGTFASEDDAAMAYNNAAIKYFGEYAMLNVIE